MWVDSLFQVPINVTVEEPRARIVREESDRHIVTGGADAHHVADDRIVKVVSRVSSTAHDVEGVSVQVNRVLE
jgi:hypothetical protein